MYMQVSEGANSCYRDTLIDSYLRNVSINVGDDMLDLGLIDDGTKCGDNMVL